MPCEMLANLDRGNHKSEEENNLKMAWPFQRCRTSSNLDLDPNIKEKESYQNKECFH
jgi:hypothetical protein